MVKRTLIITSITALDVWPGAGVRYTMKKMGKDRIKDDVRIIAIHRIKKTTSVRSLIPEIIVFIGVLYNLFGVHHASTALIYYISIEYTEYLGI